jgi:hypothetical protein
MNSELENAFIGQFLNTDYIDQLYQYMFFLAEKAVSIKRTYEYYNF